MVDIFEDTFAATLDRHFPDSIPEADFVSRTAQLLEGEGFTRENTLATVAVCRDEITRPIFADVESRWGHAFNLASLAGMMTAGTTGINAALSHTPTEDGLKRLVVYAMPHIAIDDDGTIGRVHRPGLPEPSNACGALVALRDGLAAGYVQIGVDRFDAEQSLLNHRLQPMIENDHIPDLVDLTKLAATAIEDDLSSIIDAVLTQSVAHGEPPPNGATFTGVQIHGPDGGNHVWQRTAHMVIDGAQQQFELIA
jgi:hypothetical protein